MSAKAIAERMSWISESPTMKVSAAAAQLKADGIDVVAFGAGEPDFPTPDNIRQAGIRAIEENFTKYTAASGTNELKDAVCERHRLDFGTSYERPECCINAGGKHGIFNLMQILVNPGDEVIVPVPYWVTYKDVVTFAAGVPVFLQTNEEDAFELKASKIKEAITEKTVAILVNSPNNPSGAVIEKAEFQRIVDLAREKGLHVITDECYSQLVYDGEVYSAAALNDAKETVIVCGSLSKNYSMTGWRMGFTLGPVDIIKSMSKLQSQSTSNPTSIAQKASVEALLGPQDSIQVMLAEYRNRRDYIVDRLRAMPGVTCVMPKGAFYVFPNISSAFGNKGIVGSLDFAEVLLKEAHVAAVPGFAFGSDPHLRISYATSMAVIEEGMDRIEKFLASL
jgi:aspartate aminotransferase